MTSLTRILTLALFALLLLPACEIDRGGFSRGDADDDDAADDDDLGIDDDDASDDDDSTTDFDPNCEVTIDGVINADPGDLTGLWLATFAERDTDENGFPTDGGPIELIEEMNVTYPFEYRLCGIQDGTSVIAFIYEEGQDFCMPGHLHNYLEIAPTTAAGLTDQNLDVNNVLTEEDCERDGEPPEEE